MGLEAGSVGLDPIKHTLENRGQARQLPTLPEQPLEAMQRVESVGMQLQCQLVDPKRPLRLLEALPALSCGQQRWHHPLAVERHVPFAFERVEEGEPIVGEQQDALQALERGQIVLRVAADLFVQRPRLSMPCELLEQLRPAEQQVTAGLRVGDPRKAALVEMRQRLGVRLLEVDSLQPLQPFPIPTPTPHEVVEERLGVRRPPRGGVLPCGRGCCLRPAGALGEVGSGGHGIVHGAGASLQELRQRRAVPALASALFQRAQHTGVPRIERQGAAAGLQGQLRLLQLVLLQRRQTEQQQDPLRCILLNL